MKWVDGVACQRMVELGRVYLHVDDGYATRSELARHVCECAYRTEHVNN